MWRRREGGMGGETELFIFQNGKADIGRTEPKNNHISQQIMKWPGKKKQRSVQTE